MANLTLRQDLLEKVVPMKDQGFSEGYAGIFHFRSCITFTYY
jgi:hypothetical protein